MKATMPLSPVSRSPAVAPVSTLVRRALASVARFCPSAGVTVLRHMAGEEWGEGAGRWEWDASRHT
jgi:hypothetical protein